MLSGPKTVKFYNPRMYRRKVVYLNKSNTKWIEIGVEPEDMFSPAAYFCGKGCRIRIPCELDLFFKKIQDLSHGKPVLLKGITPNCDSLSITTADYGSGVYKIFNSSESGRAVYTTEPTLVYLREIAGSVKGLYKQLEANEVKAEFDKIVQAGCKVAEFLETTDYELIEGELLQHPPPDVNMEMFFETTANFRYFLKRQLHIHMQDQ